MSATDHATNWERRSEGYSGECAVKRGEILSSTVYCEQVAPNVLDLIDSPLWLARRGENCSNCPNLSKQEFKREDPAKWRASGKAITRYSSWRAWHQLDIVMVTAPVTITNHLHCLRYRRWRFYQEDFYKFLNDLSCRPTQGRSFHTKTKTKHFL